MVRKKNRSKSPKSGPVENGYGTTSNGHGHVHTPQQHHHPQPHQQSPPRHQRQGESSTTHTTSTCSIVRLCQKLLMISGAINILWGVTHFHLSIPLEDLVDHSGFLEGFTKQMPSHLSLNTTQQTLLRGNNNYDKSSIPKTQQQQQRAAADEILQTEKVRPKNNENDQNKKNPELQPQETRRQQEQPQLQQEQPQPPPIPKTNVKPPSWDIDPQMGEFAADKFEAKLNSWRRYRQDVKDAIVKDKIRHAQRYPRQNTNSTMPMVPFLHNTPLFPRQHVSWNLMVMVMADSLCPLVVSTTKHVVGTPITVNATERLLLTVEVALQTQHANVVAYLPHFEFENKTHQQQQPAHSCRDELYQAIIRTFPTALSTGQLQVVSPPLQSHWGPAHRFAHDGLDIAYAAWLGKEYSDLCLFLQAGTRLKPNWWQPKEGEPEEVKTPQDPRLKQKIMTTPPRHPQDAGYQETKNRDYGLEILLAYENHYRLDLAGTHHDLCYINFVEEAIAPESNRRFNSYVNPTGVLMTPEIMMEYAILLRSVSPYGHYPPSIVLEQFCMDFLWLSTRPDGPRILFQYDDKGVFLESMVRPENRASVQPIRDKDFTTYPYLTLQQTQIPAWVSIEANMLGPQPMNAVNPFCPGMNDGTDSSYTKEHGKNWLTFVVPTSWRHQKDTGNVYTLDCLKQLSATIKEHFQGKYQASIVVVVTGRNDADIAYHRSELERHFGPEISEGIIDMVSVPIELYPTLHGAKANYRDEESRVRWRSKQNNDIAACYWAAKGYGKYIMVIEDDSGFPQGANFVKGIEKMMSDFHRRANPKDAVNHAPDIKVREGGGGGGGGGENTEDQIKLSNALDRALVKVQHKAHFDAMRQRRAAKHVGHRQLQQQLRIHYDHKMEPAVFETGHREIWSQARFSFGYSGVMVHDEDAFVFAMLHLIQYQQKPCDLMDFIARFVREGMEKDHFLRWNWKKRYIRHLGKHSTLEGKVFTEKEMAKG